MIALLDTNVLVALGWPNHVHHERALEWFGRHERLGWATCPLTQSGFVRVSSNARAIPGARTPREALLLLAEIVSRPHHTFWPDDTSLVSSRFLAREKIFGYRQVTDAHLLAIALRHGGRLASLDRGVRELVPQGHDADRAVVCLV